MKWQAYPKYKDSGVEWLGNIPADWQSKRLKYCVSRINEKVDGRESDLLYTGLEHIESWTGRLLPSEETPTSEGQSSCFKPGDVLFGKLRPYLVKVLRATVDGICTGELLVLRPNQVTQDYLFNYMLARDFVAIVDSSTYGAKMPRANWEFIGNLPMLLPPEDEQRAIAAFLDRETERIDALIARKERQIELLQEKRAALISHAVTRGLDPNAPMKDSGVEWLGEIPEGWSVTPLKRGLARNDGGVWGEDFDDDGTIVLRSTEIALDGSWRIEEPARRRLTTRERTDARLEVGDLLVTKSSGSALHLGKTAVVTEDVAAMNCCYSNFMQRLRVNKRLHPRYLFWILNGPVGRDQLVFLGTTTTGLANLGAEIIGGVQVPFLPLPEQRAIAAFLDRETERLDALVKKVQESITTLREHRTALISAAVTGKIQVQRTSEVRCT